MKRVIVAALFCIFVAYSSCAQSRSLTDKVDRLFAEWNTTSSPGCALAVVKDGRLTYERGYGMSNLELGIAITPQSVFDIGSVSKEITAMAMLLLVQDGKIALDDDIRKYIPEMPDYGNPITLRHMLHHTSGLRNYDDLFDLVGIPEADLTTDRDALELTVRQKGVNFKPGEEFLYSDTNFFLMSIVVKRVSGQTLRQFAQERIFAPLGMTSTHYHDNHTMIVPRRATGYAPHNDGGGFEINMSNFEQVGDGSVMTTVEDLFKWDQNFEHPIVGGPEAIRQLTTPGKLNNGQPIPYGMGLFIDHYRGLKWIHHSGEWVGYRAAFSRFPEQHFSTLLTCNCVGTMNPMGLAKQVADLYLADDFARSEKANAPQTASLPETELQQYVGTYWSQKNGALRKFEVRNNKLVMVAPGITYDMLPLGSGQFEAVEADSEHRDKYVFRPSGKTGEFDLQAWEGGAPTIYNAVKGPLPDSSHLAEYVGSYKNDELKALWKLVVRDGKLIRQQWMDEDQELQPAFPDGFIADLSEGQFLMHFNRDASNHITGFDAATEMVRPMRFTKLENHIGVKR